jgi:hypothetical protein
MNNRVYIDEGCSFIEVNIMQGTFSPIKFYEFKYGELERIIASYNLSINTFTSIFSSIYSIGNSIQLNLPYYNTIYFIGQVLVTEPANKINISRQMDSDYISIAFSKDNETPFITIKITNGYVGRLFSFMEEIFLSQNIIV